MGQSGSKCMTEHSGRWGKELEILRHFQTWSSLYKAWIELPLIKENEKRFERENTRESREEETCAVYEPVPSTVTVPSPSLNILRL